MIVVVIAKCIINFFIIGLFLYSKLLPYKDRLEGSYKSLFMFFDSVFEPLTKMLRKVVKPVQAGRTLGVDLSQVILLVLFLLVYELL